MAGRWTFVLVIALACAMVTAQPAGFLTATGNVEMETQNIPAPEEGIVLEKGDRLKITGTEGKQKEFEGMSGVLGGYNRKQRGFEITLDDTGRVEVFKPACLVKLQKGDRFKITGTAGKQKEFEGMVGVLGDYNRERRGFVIAFDTGEVEVFKPACLVVPPATPARPAKTAPEFSGPKGEQQKQEQR